MTQLLLTNSQFDNFIPGKVIEDKISFLPTYSYENNKEYKDRNLSYTDRVIYSVLNKKDGKLTQSIDVEFLNYKDFYYENYTSNHRGVRSDVILKKSVRKIKNPYSR